MRTANLLKRASWVAALVVLLTCAGVSAAHAVIRVVTAPNATPRELYAARRLRAVVANTEAPVPDAKIMIAVRTSPLLKGYNLPQFWPGASQAFILRREGSTWIVAGSDPSGVLYGSLELASRIKTAHELPVELHFEDHPALKLRGVCIGMQKATITYQGAEYDYRYTPKNFPFFYNKAEWIHYLNFLVNNRYNTLYLWNGHPFTSLLKLPRYPEAQELPTAQLDQNIAMFKWLTKQADMRGIWVVQGFYNIHLSHTFARAHGLPYHLRRPTPLASAYTKYAIAQFIKTYPSVGLLVTLGEALAPRYGAQWMTQTIIPGVKEGMREAGLTAEPPIVVRAHATDIDQVMAESLPLYHNIDAMEKWTGESLVGFDVRGKVRARDVKLANEAQIDIANVHILANLEPFRWGDPEYIRNCVLSFEKIGIKGLHLYPLRFWDWPYTADNTTPRLMQMNRDWIWFQAWGRYAWNPNRDPVAEHAYWVRQIGERYGSNEAGEKLLTAYEDSGVAAPELLPWIGITDGNRESFSLGLTMPELIHPQLYGQDTPMWTAEAPKGERLNEYVEREVAHEPQEGRTPLGVAMAMTVSSEAAVRAAEDAGQFVSKNRAEYERLLNDMRCIHTLMQYYNAKTQATSLVLLYGYDHNLAHLQEAEQLLAQSVAYYRHLTALTNTTYLAGPSLDTIQRQIPFPGGPNKFTHWRDCLPKYEKELAIFRERVTWLEQLQTSTNAAGTLPQVAFTLKGTNGQVFTVAPGAALYTDGKATIAQTAPGLSGLRGIRISQQQTGEGAEPVTVTLSQPAQVLVGFFLSGSEHHPPAQPEGGAWKLRMINGVTAKDNPSLAVWSCDLSAGTHQLNFGRGAYVVLGFVSPDAQLGAKISFYSSPQTGTPNLDWLFVN